jgi:tetratricopeptide (TPR) repeat protein
MGLDRDSARSDDIPPSDTEGTPLPFHEEIMSLGKGSSRSTSESRSPVAVAERKPHKPREAPEEVLRPTSRLSTWALVVAVGAALTFFAIALFAYDWADAAQKSIVVAGVLAAICLVTGLLSLLAAPRSGWPIWLLFGILFAVLAFYELPAAVVPLHLAQAQEAQAAGQYDKAYTEYRLAGVGACDPRATSTLMGWARQDQRSDRYGDAVVRLNALVRDCPNSSEAEAAQSQIGQTELAWGEQLVSTGDYQDAVRVFADIQYEFATTPLAPAARQDAAAAYVAWAEREEHSGRYASALAKYQLIMATYSDTSYAVTARTGAAQTLFDWGQWATRGAHYDEAVNEYNLLVDLYPETPQAVQASSLLTAPQLVVGQLIHNDGSAAAGVRVRLSSEWRFGGGGYTSAGRQYSATTDAAGIFTLGAVPPGTYLLEWVGPDGRYTTFVGADGRPLEIVIVPQLHPLTLGALDIDPTAP